MLGAILDHARSALFVPLEMRIDALEANRRRTDAQLGELTGPRGSQREQSTADALHQRLYSELKNELGRKMPSLEQIDMLQQTLSAHVQRLPALAAFPHGRWTWTRGKLKPAGSPRAPPLLPWSSEKLNTSPATFGWQADRAFVEVLASGMYVVACAVFVPGAPTIGVTVNGQTVLRRVASTRAGVVDATGLVAGASLRDVLSLAAGSRVAVQCEVAAHVGGSPMHDAHGLLEIKKLW